MLKISLTQVMKYVSVLNRCKLEFAYWFVFHWHSCDTRLAFMSPVWGQGTPFPPLLFLVHSLPHLLLFITFSRFPFLIYFTYFLLLSTRSLSFVMPSQPDGVCKGVMFSGSPMVHSFVYLDRSCYHDIL